MGMRTGLSLDELPELLTEPYTGVLATRRKDDSILLSPVWWEWRDGGINIWVDTLEDRKVAHLRRDPRTTFVVSNDRRPYLGFELRGEARISNDDFVGVVLDTFNDQRRAFEFFVNALGVQMDLIQDDVARTESDAWDAIWESAGNIDGRGYTVEIAIPFSQLRFPSVDGAQTWGIDVLRFRPRQQRARISNNAQDRNRACYLCQFGKFTGFANAEPGKALGLKLAGLFRRELFELRDAGADRRLGLLHRDGQALAEVSRGLSPAYLGSVRSLPPRSIQAAAIAARQPIAAEAYRDDPRGADVRAAELARLLSRPACSSSLAKSGHLTRSNSPLSCGPVDL